MEDLFEFVNKINEELKRHNDNQIILICGNTGCGKSTLVNYLAGVKLMAVKKKNTRNKKIIVA